MKIFNDDYGVFICNHVFDQERDVKLVVRDLEDGEWQFLCGEDDHNDNSIKHVSAGELVKKDPTLARLAELEPGYGAERNKIGDKWSVFIL